MEILDLLLPQKDSLGAFLASSNQRGLFTLAIGGGKTLTRLLLRGSLSICYSGQSSINSFLLDCLHVRAADIADALMIRIDKLSKFCREEFLHDAIIRSGTVFNSQSKALNLRLCLLKGFCELFWALGLCKLAFCGS